MYKWLHFLFLVCGAADERDYGVFKAIYYINLENATQRRHLMEEQLLQSGMLAERLSGVAPDKVATGDFDEEFIKPQGVRSRIKELVPDSQHRVIGCFLSHVMALMQAHAKLGPDEIALIMEDDVKVPADWKSKVQLALEDAPEGWALLKISGWGNARESDYVPPTTWDHFLRNAWAWTEFQLQYPNEWRAMDFYEMREPFLEGQYTDGKYEEKSFYAGTGGYIVRGSSIRDVLEHLRSKPIDDLDSMLLSAPWSPTRFYEGWPHILDMADDHWGEKNHQKKASPRFDEAMAVDGQASGSPSIAEFGQSRHSNRKSPHVIVRRMPSSSVSRELVLHVR